MQTLVVAEKPSVARDIARVLGAGAEGTVLHAADLRKLRAQFKDEIGELLKKGK